MKMKMMILTALMLLFSSMFVYAELEVTSVKINTDEVLGKSTNYNVERGDDLNIRVRVTSNTSENNVVAEAKILGYEFSEYNDPLYDKSGVLNMDANDDKTFELNLKVPENAERDNYDLRIIVASRKGQSKEYLIHLDLEGQRNRIVIRDIQLQDTALAGRSMIGNVRIKNIGEQVEDSIKITLSIPDLSIEDSEYIDELDPDDSTTSEDLLLRIPACSKPGTYDVVAEVEYHDGYKITSKTSDITVLESDACESTGGVVSPTIPTRTVITVPSKQEVLAGQSIVYPIVISNLGKTSKTYVVTPSPSIENIGEYRLDPSNVVIIPAQGTETVYLYLTVDEAMAEGMKDFRLTVQTDDESKDLLLTADVKPGKGVSSDGLKKGLQVSLSILVVLLIVLLIIFGFNKLKRDKEEEDEDSEQTYY